MRTFLSITILTLLFSCNKVGVDVNELNGTTWEIYQYKEPSSTNPIALGDTLVFSSHKDYSYNTVGNTYTLTHSSNQKVLSLYGSKFGDISGRIPNDFSKYGEILGVTFSTTSDIQSEYILWMKKIN